VCVYIYISFSLIHVQRIDNNTSKLKTIKSSVFRGFLVISFVFLHARVYNYNGNQGCLGLLIPVKY